METLNKDLPPNSFIEKVTQIIHENLSNEQFGVESLAEISGISRSQLFKNIKKATGKSASQFIRDVKLELAFSQLKGGDSTVSQVAYNVGFSSHAYFATCFKDYFGYSPSEVKAREETFQDSTKVPFDRNVSPKRNRILATALVLVTVVLGVIIINTISKTKIDKEKTVAVIRFDNMTDDDGDQGFVDGLGEEIINSLCKIHDLKVTARNSSFQFSKDDDVTKISKILNVNYVLEGSVRKENNTYRITIQLIDASDGYHLWSKTYDRKQKDVLFLQEEISRIVAHELEVQLSEKDDKALRSRITSDSLAYQLFNESIKTAASNNIDALQKSVELMNQAIEVDSNFAMAHARIVDLYRQNNFVGHTDYTETTQLMEKHVNKAFMLNPTLAEAFIAQGYLASRKGDKTKAMHSFEKAVELAPNEPRAHFALAGTYIVFNRVNERFKEMKKAFELDPLNPRISLMVAQYFYYNERDFKKGITTLENSINKFPGNDLAECHLEMYRASLPKGDLVGAFKNYFEMYKETPNERRELNWLANCSYWLDLKPMSEVLNNKMRLSYPKNIHTFWNMYSNNGLHGRFTENIDLVEFWVKDQKLNMFDQVNYLAESYINSNKPKLARKIIEDSLPNIKDASFLLNAKKYNSLKSIRLDIIEKYIITLRELNEYEKVDSYVNLAVEYIDSELSKLSKDQFLDYRYELYLNLIKASVEDDVEKLITVFGKAFFEDKHRVWMYDELVTLARYHRFKEHPKFVAFLKRVTNEVHSQRSEVISYLKQEGYWESSWDDKF